MRTTNNTAKLRKAGVLALSAVLAAGYCVPAPALAQAGQAASAQVRSVEAMALEQGEGLKNDLTWTLEGGVLTIAGNGAMEYADDADAAPWLVGWDENRYSLKETTGISKVVIGEGVTSIAADAFNHVTSLKEVQISSTVTTIGSSAFRDCEALESIVIPDTVQTIGDNVFGWCRSLASVTLPSGLTSIPAGLFAGDNSGGCTSLRNVVIPNTVTAIGNKAFARSAIESITLPDGLKTIGQEAFNGCAKLTAISIPAAVDSIDMLAFQNCTALETVSFGSQDTKVGQAVFDNTPYLNNMGDWPAIKGVLQKYNASNVSEVVIPAHVTAIAASAFEKHSEITKVTIPSSVTVVGNFAFLKCSNLKLVVFEGMKAPMVKSGIVDGCAEGVELQIPEGATGYQAGTEGFERLDSSKPYADWNYWETYADIVGTRQQLDARKAAREAAKAQAEAVTTAIVALPSVADVRLADKDKVDAVAADFEALGEYGQALVSDALKDKLQDVRNQLQRIVDGQDVDGIAIDASRFPDGNLRAALLRYYDLDRNERLSDDELVSELDLENARISNLAGLEVFEDLVSLDVAGNSLSVVDLRAFPYLEEIDLSGNKLSGIDLSACEDLEEVVLSRNALTSIDLKRLGNLKTLDVSNNRLAAIDVSKNSYLTSLDVSGNKLGSIDLKDVTSLATLDVSNNALTALDLSSCIHLAAVAADGNQIADMAFGNNTALSNLSVKANKLATLDVHALTGLGILDVDGNPMVALDLGSNSKLAVFSAKDMGGRVAYGASKTIDLKSKDASFDPAKVSELEGAKLDGSVLSGFTGNTVTYTYACNAANKMLVTLTVASVEDFAKVDAAVASIEKAAKSSADADVAAARRAYDALDSKQKSLVGQASVEALEKAERVVGERKAAADKAAAARAALAKASNINSKTVTAKQVRAAAALGATQVTLGPGVKKVAKGAFAGTKVKTVVVKSKKLTKKGVKGSLKGSKVKTVKVSVGNKKANKKFAKKYKGFFTKKNCGLKGVKVK